MCTSRGLEPWVGWPRERGAEARLAGWGPPVSVRRPSRLREAPCRVEAPHTPVRGGYWVRYDARGRSHRHRGGWVRGATSAIFTAVYIGVTSSLWCLIPTEHVTVRYITPDIVEHAADQARGRRCVEGKELFRDEASVQSAPFEEIRVRALLPDPPPVDHHDPVRPLHRAQSVRNDHHRATPLRRV